MQYTTKKCPHCGNTYQFMQGQTLQYGSPLRTCRKCRNNFVDKDYIEIAISGIRTVDTMKISPISILCAIMFIPFGIFLACFTDIEPVGIFITIVGLICPISDFISYNKRMKWLQEETNSSYQRLYNTQYAQTILQLGYNVPKQFLVHGVSSSVQSPTETQETTSKDTVITKNLDYYNAEFKKRFSSYYHPYTGKKIETAQDYIDSVLSQQYKTCIESPYQLSVTELNGKFYEAFHNCSITNMDDYLYDIDKAK